MTHPPIANKVVCVDFDGTIVPWGPLMADKEPFRGVRTAMQRLRAAGFRIVIFTSRLSPSWLESDPTAGGRLDQIEYITRILSAAEIPYDAITSEKVPAEYYFDDRAIQVTTSWPLDAAINHLLATRKEPAA